MASRHRVENLSRPGYYMNQGAALRAIEACSVKWVVEGESVRFLTHTEAVAARNERAKLSEPLPYAEIPGITFEPPVSGIGATRRESRLLYDAHHFAMTMAA